MRGTEEDKIAKARSRERRRKRYPVPSEQIPPFDRAISTVIGVIIVDGLEGEIAEAETLQAFYFSPVAGHDYVWVAWRTATLEELVTTWPARSGPTAKERDRGWWPPTLDELRTARRDARSREKSRQRQSRETSDERTHST